MSVPATHSKRRGFTIVEATMSVLIVSIMLVAAISAGDVAVVTQYRTGDRATGRLLADGLMSDIRSLPYQDPQNTTFACGTDPGETASSKVNYDDVDDFNGWSETPPQDRNGNVIPGFSNWTRAVTAQWCSPTNLNALSAFESGCKVITVRVSHNGVLVATRVSVKVSAP